MDNASEWQEVLKTAVKTALILVVLDMLRLSKNSSWFEEHADFVSMQAVLCARPRRRRRNTHARCR
jgi:hypothetical protein